jgi:NADH-quinone oxidoreductase subunit J
VALATAGVLVTVIGDAVRTQWFDPRGAVALGTTKANGNALFKYWVLPFELLSVLLLAALVGAIVLSRTDVSADADAETAEKAPERAEA